MFKAAGLRVETDLRNEKIDSRVQEHASQKVPVQIALGGREAEDRTVTVRRHGTAKSETVALDDAVQALVAEVSSSSGQR